MFVTVKFFATYRDLLGEDQLVIDIDEGVTVGDILEILKDRFPTLKDQGYMPLTACNLKHVSKRHVLTDGDELAVFPPVSGG